MGGLLICGLLGVSTWLTVGALQSDEAAFGAYHGVVKVQGFCRFEGRLHDQAKCTGTFRSDDGILVVPDVRIEVKAHRDFFDSTEPIPARLSGPTDQTAAPDRHDLTARLTKGGIAVVLLAWAVAQTIWWFRHRARERARQL